MLAFVDESARVIGNKRILSLGFFVSSDFTTAYSVLVEGYKCLLDRYSVSVDREELKFSNVLNAIVKKLGHVSVGDVVRMFWSLADRISNYGYPIAFVFDRYGILDIIPTIREYIEFIEKPKIRGRIIRALKRQYRPSNKVRILLSAFIFVHILFRSKKIIVDQKLLERIGLEFINISVRELGFRFHVEYYTPQYEKGIMLADFVAGFAKYVNATSFCLATEPMTVFRRLEIQL